MSNHKANEIQEPGATGTQQTVLLAAMILHRMESIAAARKQSWEKMVKECVSVLQISERLSDDQLLPSFLLANLQNDPAQRLISSYAYEMECT